MSEPDLGVCSSCGALLLWVKSAKTGRPMPLDREPVPDGNIVLTPLLRSGVYLGRNDTPPEGELRYRSHFATCPGASQFRRAPGRRIPARDV